jgi:peptidoglycan/xylan/chitin deacetylase (PgdA/CDA1 family)
MNNNSLIRYLSNSLISVFTFLIIMYLLSGNADAFVYLNATNNANEYFKLGHAGTESGASGYLGVYSSRARMVTVMNWTLPNGSGNTTKIALSMYCKKWDSFPATPVELHVLNERFNKSGAIGSSKISPTNWTNPGAMLSLFTNSTAVDKVIINKEGIYTWVLKGKGSINSQDSLTWNDTVILALTLPNEEGWHGVMCDSKENNEAYYRPYIAVTNESILSPKITNITTFKVQKTSALILSDNDATAHTRINYGKNISNLDKWSAYDTMTKSSYNILTSLLPDTTYYYRLYSYNYIDTKYSTASPLFNFTTPKDVTNAYIPLVTFVFDDGLKSTYTRALPILSSFHFPGMTAVISSTLTKEDPRYLNLAELQTIQNKYKWEIASHSITHPHEVFLNETQLDYELNESKNTLQSDGLNIHNFISPFGSHNMHTEAHIMKYYDSDRSTSGGPIIPPYDEYPLEAKSIWNTTTPDEAKAWVDEAISNNSWLILVFHNIADYPKQDTGMWTDGEWSTGNLTELAKYVESKGDLRVVTIREAQTMSFNYKGIYNSIAGNNLTNTIFPDGTVRYSKTVTGHNKVNMTILPSSDYVDITVFDWSSSGNYYKRWNETSVNSSVSVYHIIGDFPLNTPVQIKKNGYNWRTLISNTSGYITFVYDEGYSEHQFEAIASQSQPQGHIPVTPLMIIIAIFVLFGLMIIVSKYR